MNIFILSDSLSNPRAESMQKLSDSWPYRLYKSEKSFIHLNSIAGGTTRELKRKSMELGFYFGSEKSFDLAILQLGIVDCTPRTFPKSLSRLLPPGSTARYCLTSLKQHLGLKRKPWISSLEFQENFTHIYQFAKRISGRVICIPIAPAAGELLIKVPSINQYIADYNELLHSVAKTDYYQNIFDNFCSSLHLVSDGHHLTTEGHSYIADQLNQLII